MHHVSLFFPLGTSSVERGGAVRHSLSLFFPCSADHERDWPRCKVFFSGWQPIRRMRETTATKQCENSTIQSLFPVQQITTRYVWPALVMTPLNLRLLKNPLVTPWSTKALKRQSRVSHPWRRARQQPPVAYCRHSLYNNEYHLSSTIFFLEPR